METVELLPARIRIASILRKAIYSGEYHSGDELSLTEVANHLGISRTPVREAFQTLEAEGLITLRMNRGAIVNNINRKFIQDHFEIRLLLESEAAARAAERGMSVEPLLSQVKDLSTRLNTSVRSEYELLNQNIHMAIWTAADNQKLKSYLLELWNGPSTTEDPAARLHHYQKSTQEHILLLEAIQRKDAKAARTIMTVHIQRSMENILSLYPVESEEK